MRLSPPRKSAIKGGLTRTNSRDLHLLLGERVHPAVARLVAHGETVVLGELAIRTAVLNTRRLTLPGEPEFASRLGGTLGVIGLD